MTHAPAATCRPPGAWRPAGAARQRWLLLACALPATLALAQPDGGDWRLRHVDADTGTRVWLRERADGPPAFRASLRVQARLSSLAALLLDGPHMPEWVYRTKSVQRLQQDGPQRGVSLVVTAMPWPLDDRESVVAWQLRQSPASLAVTLSGQGVEPAGQPWLPAPAPGRVRMPSFASRWTFTPVAGLAGEVEVVFEGHGDLGGNLALPLLRLFVDAAIWEAPLQTVNALPGMLQRPAYRDAVLPFITEPAP